MTAAQALVRPPGTSRAAWFNRRLGLSLIRNYRLWTVLVVGLMVCNVFLRLGSARIDDSDEARYGVAAYEMLRSHDWIVPTYAHAPETWNLKPPLGYWFMALSFRLLGPTAFAMRLPSALCGVLAVMLTMALARRWLGRRQAILAGAVLATAFGFVSHHGARNGDLDAMLTVLVILAMAQMLNLRGGWRRPVLLGITLGAIFLLKSFAVLPVIAIGVVFALVAKRRPTSGAIAIALGGVVLAAVAWALARWHADGSPWFLRQMLREDLVERSTRYIDKGAASMFGYMPSMLDRFAPWPLIALPAGALAWRRRDRRWRRPPALPLLLVWSGVPFLLFSIVRTQHHWYMDPIYPACAMLAASAVVYLQRLVRPERRPAVFAALVLLPLVLCETRLLNRVLVGDAMPASQSFLAALAAERVHFAPTLRAEFPLRHSERFLLEVVDGFEVTDPPPCDGAAPPAPQRLTAVSAAAEPGRLLASEAGVAVYARDRRGERSARGALVVAAVPAGARACADAPTSPPGIAHSGAGS